MQLRPYQQEAVASVYDHLRSRDDNPCIVLPTGTGKSLVIAQIVRDAVQNWSGRVLVLAHVKELLEQNAGKIQKLCPDIKVGIFSAGLKSRDTDEQVIIAGIQSVYDKACDLGAFDLIIIDESHLIPPDGDGMYRKFLTEMKVINPNFRLIGLTATPFRLKGGLICQPENLLNHVCYEAGLKEMINQGYLAPLVSKAGRTKADLDGLHIRGGEFIADEVAEAMDREELVNSACSEIVQLTRDRKSVLIFCASVDHCRHVAERIEYYSGKECAAVTGSTSAAERAEIIARFRGEQVPDDFFSYKKPLKFLANVNVLTTGFDAPNTDCVVLLRPTNSAGLLVQMVGRGTRLAPEKSNCLVLDYGGNIMRHGPIDMIEIKEKREGKGEAPAKTCPECLTIIHAAYQACPECGHEFPPPEKGKHDAYASSADILSGQAESNDYEVSKTFYEVHSKRGAPDDAPKTMRVDYQVGFNDYRSEWVCPEHSGYAREKFLKWWRERAAPELPIPKTAHDAVLCGQLGLLAEPTRITVKVTAGDDFRRVCNHVLSPVPEFGPEQEKLMSHYRWEEERRSQAFDCGDDDEIPF